MKRPFDGVQKDFDQLFGTRRRALERPLVELEALRREKGLPVDGALFELDDVRDRSTASDRRARARRR